MLYIKYISGAFECFDQPRTMPVEGDANTPAVEKNALPTKKAAAEARVAAKKVQKKGLMQKSVWWLIFKTLSVCFFCLCFRDESFSFCPATVAVLHMVMPSCIIADGAPSFEGTPHSI